jgi:hypothetical protein
MKIKTPQSRGKAPKFTIKNYAAAETLVIADGNSTVLLKYSDPRFYDVAKIVQNFLRSIKAKKVRVIE